MTFLKQKQNSVETDITEEVVMANKDRQIVRFLDEIAQELNLKLCKKSHDWVLLLSDNSRTKYVYGYNFDLNPAAAMKIVGDKAATFDVLSELNIPCVEHRLFLRPSLVGYVDEEGNWEGIKKTISDFNGFPVVCKINEGRSSGSGVICVDSQQELEHAVTLMFSKTRGLVISPFIDIKHEIRFVVLDGDILLSFEKIKGDDWRHNLSQGAEARLIETEEFLEAKQIALKAANGLGLKFCSVDVVIDQSDLAQILEINSGIMLETFSRQSDLYAEKAKDVYRKAVQLMFR